MENIYLVLAMVGFKHYDHGKYSFFLCGCSWHVRLLKILLKGGTAKVMTLIATCPIYAGGFLPCQC